MRGFIGLIKRDILVYMKDRQAVFFSLLTPLIVFGLYVIFLRGTFVSGLRNALGDAKELVGDSDINSFANLILLAGVIGSSVITVSYSSLTTIVTDKTNRIDYDISATPIKRAYIILAYLIAGFINAFIVSAVLLTGGLIIISLINNTYLSFVDYIKLYALTALGSLSATAFLMIIVMLFKSTQSAGAFEGLLCAGTGFVIGAYIPIAEFNPAIQTIANLFPGSHITAMFRDVLLSGVLENIDTTLNGVDNHMIVTSLREGFSVNINMFNQIIPSYGNIIYTVAFLALSFLLCTIIYSKCYKRK